MKRLLAATAAVMIAAPAVAQVVDFDAMDVDGDNRLSLQEVLRMYPSFSPSTFEQLDTDSDRFLTRDEANTGEAAEAFSGIERAEAAMMDTPFDPAAVGMTPAEDGSVTVVDVQTLYPNVPQVYLQDFDLDNDGRLDSEELNSGAFQALLDQYAN